MTAPIHETHAAPSEQSNDQNLLPRRIYGLRILGMGLGGLAALAVFVENNAPLGTWIWLLLSCVVWPHLAYIKAIRSARPFVSERGSLMCDSFIAGTMAALTHFNVLPAVILVSITTADKISSGIRNLWLRSLPALMLGVVLGAGFTGFSFQPHTSMPVLLACLPVLVIHTLLVSMGSYKQVRKLQHKNRTLAELSKRDALTHLYNRRHWDASAENVLNDCRQTNQAGVLMLFDVDQFKSLNDQLGHASGDDVLCRVAEIMTRQAPATSTIGRLGGDEFALVMRGDADEGRRIAERIRSEVASIPQAVNNHPGCTVSIGLACLNSAHDGVRQWLKSADEALYNAKRAGRDRVVMA